MQEKSRKLMMWGSLAVGVIVSILAIVFAASQNKDVPGIECSWAFDIAFWVVVLYIVGSLALMALWWILAIVKKPKGFLIVLGCLVVIIGAALLLSINEVMPEEFLLRYQTSAGAAKLIAIACYSTYIIAFAACVLLVYVEIAKVFKKK